jgi:galactose mutarotase-like enzyme
MCYIKRMAEPGNFENIGLKVEKIKSPEGSEVSYCRERGGIITSIKIKGKEILYLDEATFQNTNVNVKGGIPMLFPNSGPLTSEQYPKLKQHGFARLSNKWLSENKGNEFTEKLTSDEKTKELYPHDFQFSIDGKFEDGSFTLNQRVENLNEEKEMPISMGLHPYFKVPNEEKKNIKFNFEGGQIAEEQFEVWANDGTVSLDNPKIKDPEAVVEVFVPSLGTLKINASIEYKKILVWSLPEKNFVCIEPVMRDDGGLVDDPEMIKSKGTFSSTVNFNLQ